jgi:hypothetical protein
MSREERNAQKKVVDELRLNREAKEVPSKLHRQHLEHEYYEHQQAVSSIKSRRILPYHERQRARAAS